VEEVVDVKVEDETARVTALAEPLAARRDLDLVEIQIKGTGGRRLVRVVVGRKGGVDVADCQALSRELSDALDAEDPVAGTYALEVTSPGVDYPLRDRAAFDRVEGLEVLIHRSADGTPAPLRGAVRSAEEDAVVLDVGGELVRVPYTDIRKATQALPW
jgi:ribosome maturation factor RimP